MNITEYLRGKDSKVELENTELKDSDYCQYIAKAIKGSFGIEITEMDLLRQAINGQGQEKDKITSAYSSSLQSFLIFRKVRRDNPIKIGGIEYTKVEFEVENPVIGYKSSVDVKLSNEKGNVLFLESKLYEVVRDSKKGEGTFEIGPSYFSNDNNGYKVKLKLEYEDLDKIGIHFPYEDLYGKYDKSKTKKAIIESGGHSKGYARIDAIKNNDDWVYSYGIKQILSHIIGILNYKKQKEHQNEKIRFAYVYNALPEFEIDNAQSKLKSYLNHVQEVYNLLQLKPPSKPEQPKLEPSKLELYSSFTYQELFSENKESYFPSIEDSVCKYYKLSKPIKKEDELEC